MALVEVNKRLYELKFDTVTGEHIDESPFIKGKRSNEEYYCSCKCDSSFTTFSAWKYHTNLKVHQNYRKNFQFLNKPLLDARAMIIDMKREDNKQNNKYKGLKLRYRELEKKLDTQNDLKIMIKKLEDENRSLQQTITSINDYTVTDSDEEFEDCSTNY